MANFERTCIATKPDGVQRGLAGEIIKCFKQKGFHLVAMKFLRASEEHLKQHHIDLKDRPSFLPRAGEVHELGACGSHGLGGAQCGEDRPNDAGRDQSS
ncbi:hypothetical protein ACRRTK_001799 [Alexandromys fortis]